MKEMPFLWLLPFISFIVGYSFFSYLYLVDTVHAPSIVGMQIEKAFPLLSESNLNIRLIAVKLDPELPDGTILSQTPAAQTPIKSHQAMYVVVSQKPPKISMPVLVNKSAEAIEQELKSAAIRNKTYLHQSNFASGVCIGQFPASGTPLEEKKVITYLSSGMNKPVLLPKFKNKSIFQVTDFLDMHAIKYTVYHQGLRENGHQCTDLCLVNDQRPLAYSIINRQENQPIHVYLQVHHSL